MNVWGRPFKKESTGISGLIGSDDEKFPGGKMHGK